MKKLMSSLFILLAMQGFSDTCSFISNPDSFLDRVIKKIQREKKDNDVFCDRDKLRMAYYTIENEDYNMNVGIAINADQTTTNSEFKRKFYEKFNEYKNFLTNVSTSNLGKAPLPDKEIMRFYVQFPDQKNIIIIGKYEYDMKSRKYTMVANERAKSYFDTIQLFDQIPNVVYSEEGHIY